MEANIPQEPKPEITVTTIRVPSDIWNGFRAKAVAGGRTVLDCLPEALKQWAESQPN